MPQTVQETLKDPKFYGLPSGEQQKVLATLDPKFGALPLAERNKVLQMGKQGLDSVQASVPNSSPPAPPEGFWSSVAAPFVGAAKGLKSAIYEGPQNPSEAAIVGANEKDPSWQSPILGRAVLAAKRILVDPQVDQGKQALEALKQANTKTPWYSFNPSPSAIEDRELALGHGLAAAIPMLGPWAAQVGEKEGEQVGTGDYTGAAGTAFGNAALALTPKVLGGVKDLVPGTMRRLAGSGPRVARELVRDATETNRKTDISNANKMTKAQQEWKDAQAKADYDHKANLLSLRQKYEQDTRNAVEKARTGTAEDRAQYQSKQLAAKQKYDQDVRDANENHASAVAKAQQENVEAQRAYNQKIGETVQQNRAATEAEQAKTAQNAQLQVGGSQLIYGLRQLDKALRDRASQMYDSIREKVGSASLPGTDLAQVARAALSKIAGTSVTPTVFRDILGKYPEAEPETISYQGAQIPRSNPLYDVLVKNGAVESPPVTFANLQGYYSELGTELSKGTLPSDVYQATRALQDSIGDMMQKLADKAKVGDKFWDARVFYRKYMDTFHEPTGPSSSGSPVAQALLAKDPLVAVDKFSDKTGDRGIADLRRYSDSLANLAQDIQRRAQSTIKVPERKAVTDLNPPKAKPVPAGANLPLPPVSEAAPSPRASNRPLPPVLPEAEQVPFRQPKLAPRRTISAGDLQRANEAAVRARAAGLAGHLFWWTGVWPAFRMLSELSKGAEVSLKPLALMPAAGAAGMATEELLGHPAVMDFLTRATRQQVATIPPDLRGSIPDIVTTAKSRGIPVSPILAAYATSIQKNRAAQPVAQGAQQ